jgi:hypothetical protein
MANEKYNDHTRIYTDGSKKEVKAGYVNAADQKSTRRRIRDQSSIYILRRTICHHRRNTAINNEG